MNIYKHNWLLAFKFINICNEFRYMLIECKTDTFFYALFLNPEYKCGATQHVLESFRDISSAQNRYWAETTENLQNIVIYQPNIHLHSGCYFYWQKIYCMIKDTTNLQPV